MEIFHQIYIRIVTRWFFTLSNVAIRQRIPMDTYTLKPMDCPSFLSLCVCMWVSMTRQNRGKTHTPYGYLLEDHKGIVILLVFLFIYLAFFDFGLFRYGDLHFGHITGSLFYLISPRWNRPKRVLWVSGNISKVILE